MAKRLLILSRYPHEYEPQRLLAAARRQGLIAEVLSYRRFSLRWQPGQVEIKLANGRRWQDYHYLIPRAASKPGSSLVALKTMLLEELLPGQVCLNQATFRRFPLTSKLLQGMILAQQGLAVVPSFVFNSAPAWQEFLQNWRRWPLVVKANFGSHGRQVWLLNSRRQAKEKLAAGGWTSLIAQPYLASRYWWRCLVLGGKILGAVRRPTRTRFLSAKAKDFGRHDLDQTARQLCQQASQILKTDFAGLDLIPVADGWRLLEVNRTPQFRVFERHRQLDVAAAIISFLRQQG